MIPARGLEKLDLSDDNGPHAVVFPGCEGLEGGWDYPDGRRRRLVSQNRKT